MAKNTQHIPYTELQERAMELGRYSDNAKKKVRGLIQDAYLREIGTKYDWDFLYTESSFTTEKAYNTGTIAINTGSTTASFTNSVIDADLRNRTIKIAGVNGDYKFDYVSSSDGTISPALRNTTNVSGSTFWITRNRYSLASDFDRFPKNGGIYKWEGSQKKRLDVVYYQEQMDNYSNSPSDPRYMRLVGKDTKNCPLVEIYPPPKEDKNYPYDYLRLLRPLSETSEGTVTIAKTSNTVNGTGCKFTDATTGDWIRVDAFGTSADSEWYQILSISNDNTLTLNGVFGSSGCTAEKYVISSAPEFPTRLQPAILYRTLMGITTDESDPMIEIYKFKYDDAMTDCKKEYVTRNYNQEIPTLASEEFKYRW